MGCLDSMERGTVEWNSGTVEWNGGMVERWNSGMGQLCMTNDPVPRHVFVRAHYAAQLEQSQKGEREE